MTPKPTGDSVADCLAKSRQLLDDSRANLDMGRLETAVDRAYYAMYHAVRALLTNKGIPLPKTHSGLRSVFGDKLVKSGKVPRRFYKSLARGAQLREEATYTIYAKHGPDVTKVLVEEAEEFVAMAEKECGTTRSRVKSRSRRKAA